MIFNKIPVLFVAALLLVTTQCNTQPLPQLAGKIQLSTGWKPVLYLVQPRSFAEIGANFSGTVIDSASIASDGSFAFLNIPPHQGDLLLQLCIQKNGARFANQLLEDDLSLSNYMPLVLQKDGQVRVAAEADRLQASFVIQNPSAENRALLQLRDLRQSAFQRLHQLTVKETDHSDESALLEREAALRQFQQTLMDFADSTAYVWPAMVAIRWVSPASDYERVPEFLFGQCQKWNKQTIDNQWVAQLCKSSSPERLPVLTGDIIPNAALPMAQGDTIQFQTLLGKKLTILDIWASWCGPCRRENREVLAPLWAQYHEKGLQIVGYSIDSGPAAWKAAIIKDGAAWPQASHLSGDATPFLETLRITTIPANFMLDGNGKVVAKNLYGDALKAFLADYMR